MYICPKIKQVPIFCKKEVFVIMNMASGKGNSLKDKKKNLKTPTHLLTLHLCPYSVLPTIYHVIKVSYFLKVP